MRHKKLPKRVYQIETYVKQKKMNIIACHTFT